MTCILFCIVHGATGLPRALNWAGAFKIKLELHSINNPNADAISPLASHFPQQMMMLMAQAQASSDDAMSLYKLVKQNHFVASRASIGSAWITDNTENVDRFAHSSQLSTACLTFAAHD